MTEGTAPAPLGSYTVALLAARWGTSTTFVYEEIDRGRLRAFKLGAKLWRIKPEAVADYEAAAEAAAIPPPPAPPTADAASIGRLVRRERRPR